MTTQLPEKTVLPHCPAPRHNSTIAARGYGLDKRVPADGPLPLCICPYSLAIAKRRKEAMVAWGQRKRGTYGFPVLPTWWSGPWKIDEECPAERHWTPRAYRGHVPMQGNHRKYTTGNPRCTCPRAEAAYRKGASDRSLERVALRAEQRQEREARLAAERRSIAAASLKETGLTGVRWDKRECKDLHRVFDKASDGRAHGPQIDAAKRVCQGCPIIEDCLAYAVQHNEQGIWGGTTTQQRRSIMRKKAMQDA